LTSAESLRLDLVAKPIADGPAAPQPAATAAARIEPTVMPTLEEHVETVYRYALRLTRRHNLAEDVTQETLLRGWRKRSMLRDPRATRVWLLRIATNVWTDQLRKLKTRPQSLEAEPPCPAPLPAAVHDDRENVRQALAVMDTLPPRQRQVLYLVTCEQLTHPEVADVLGMSMAAVKSNLSRARKEMRLRLKDVYQAVCARTPCETNERD
jgi:RNA polymerase sigma-70 factor (ECF subfamily)